MLQRSQTLAPKDGIWQKKRDVNPVYDTSEMERRQRSQLSTDQLCMRIAKGFSFIRILIESCPMPFSASPIVVYNKLSIL